MTETIVMGYNWIVFYLLVRIGEQTAWHVRCVGSNCFAFDVGVIFHTQWINSDFVIKPSRNHKTGKIVKIQIAYLSVILLTNPQATKFPEGAKAQAITLIIKSITQVKKENLI